MINLASDENGRATTGSLLACRAATRKDVTGTGGAGRRISWPECGAALRLPHESRCTLSSNHVVDPSCEYVQHLAPDFRIRAATARRHMKGMIGICEQLQCRALAECVTH